MADNKSVMEFIETPVFTKLITELLPDDSYRLLMILKTLVKELERHGRRAF